MDHSPPEHPSIELAQSLPSAELDDAVHQRIVELSHRGDELTESDQFADALLAYDEAVALHSRAEGAMVGLDVAANGTRGRLLLRGRLAGMPGCFPNGCDRT